MSREEELAIFDEGGRFVSRDLDGVRKRIEELRK
jgi:hypothetical protein